MNLEVQGNCFIHTENNHINHINQGSENNQNRIKKNPYETVYRKLRASGVQFNGVEKKQIKIRIKNESYQSSKSPFE
ncbi:MAG: hypothetical protein LBG80_14800 [Bacteroidales bacterium]|jgi:hypothetical protein|nr:hypothetical protein [Bacteroidales bacterium]